MLRDLQQQFLDGLFSEQESPPIVGWLSETGRRRPDEQFATYRQSVIAGIIDALAETCPVCKKLVGERFFNAMATRFILGRRSHSPDLNGYGQELADFIDTFAPAESVPYLGDIVRLEWAWQSVLDGATPPPGNLHELSEHAAHNPDAIRFRLHGNSALLASPYPVHRIWQANQKDAVDEEIDLEEGGVMLFVWRNGVDMRMVPLDEKLWRFLVLLAADMPFGEVCARMDRLFAGVDLGALLGDAMQRGWITGFE